MRTGEIAGQTVLNSLNTSKDDSYRRKVSNASSCGELSDADRPRVTKLTDLNRKAVLSSTSGSLKRLRST